MLLQDKKGLSIMIGYVLLVVIAIVMSLIVYQWVKTYIPKDAIECSEDVSVFLEKVEYDCTTEALDITVKNNGLFNIAGYFIHATEDIDDELATVDLSDKINSGGVEHGGSIVFITCLGGDDISNCNTLIPNDARTSKFINVENLAGHKIEIIPVRWEVINEKNRFASCSNAKVGQVLSCVESECTDGDIQDCPFQDGVCAGSERTCVNEEWSVCDYGVDYEPTEITCDGVDDNDCMGDTDAEDTDCGGTCIEGDTQLCLLQYGVCESSSQTCVGGAWAVCDYGVDYESTEITCDGVDDNDCDGSIDSSDSDCPIEDSCNGDWNPPEDAGVVCDGTPTPDNCVNCVCTEPYVSVGDGTCEIPSDFSCGDYCALFEGYGTGGCVQNPQQCPGLIPPGTYIGDIPGADPEIGNGECDIGNSDTCCCQP